MRRVERSLLVAWVACSVLACGPTENPGANASAGAGGSTSGAGAGGAAATGGASAAGGSGGANPSGGAGNVGGASGASQGGMSGSSPGGAGGSPVVVERPPLVTSGPGAYWQVGTLTPASGAATVTVDPNSTLQQWIGFGGTFNEAGWDALSELTQGERDRAIRLLFSPSEGANFAWGRIPIGASDYAIDRYTLNETAGDHEMASFSIERDKQRLIPYIKAAQLVKGDIKFWASPWTPPSWMKIPQEIDGTDAGPNGEPATFEAKMNGDDAILDAYALYFARFIEEYAKEGITIDHVQPQNEPGYATRYPSCKWDAGLLGTFVGDHLGPTLAERGLSTKIWFGTLSNDTAYPDHIGGVLGGSANPAAAGYLAGVGLQWNTMGRIDSILSTNSSLLIMQTEHRCGNYPFTVPNTPPFNPDKPPNDHAYAVESWGYIRDWIEAGSHAYSAWNMVLDTIGKSIDAQRPWPQNALLVVDREADQLIETPVYYVFRHLSFFVDPGATRLATTGGDALAFKNPDGSLVAVLFNSGAQPADTAVALGATTVQVQVPAQGWATVYSKG